MSFVNPDVEMVPLVDFLPHFLFNAIIRLITTLSRHGDSMLTTQQIMEIIPHRHPFLMIDRILELEPGVRSLGEKLVSINEPFFTGHFPNFPIMPGVLIVEALAQTGAVAVLSLPEYSGKMVYFAGTDRIRFRRPVHPGDILRLEVTLDRLQRGIGKGKGRATVNDKVVCDGGLLFAINDQP
jgi:3-hydroxyacyl-[acyl-carrier-protein] dehydratase